MIFKQLFEADSSTFTYLIADSDSGAAILIDPVRETVERDLQVLKDMNLTLSATLETHVHADHLTGCRVVFPAIDELPCADIGIREGEPFRVGNIELHPLFTPGHTSHHHAYLIDNGTHKLLFSGDAKYVTFDKGDATLTLASRRSG